MRKLSIASLLLLACGVAQAQNPDCAAIRAPQAMPLRPTVLAPISSELFATRSQLGAPSGVLAQAYDETMSVDVVLLRLRVQGCNVANATPAPSALDPNNPSVYKPKTQFDNTPYRFNMTQNGKRMTADDFDAWLKATGYSAGRRAQTTPPPVEAPKASPDGAVQKTE
ncbi:hypothetical protein IP90_02563 [Luteimonas cucumeris]|uniref:Secreted protein n=2 Tax=Luteimonas cucumeris TaxID=985012 RepID=A0A562KZW2_9GAMM|nr:hypothetical protein IP90_02563 [Luteimonas cucumeris]